MPTPLPTDVDLQPPEFDEVALLGGGVAAAIAPEGGLTTLQGVLVESMFRAMTGHSVDLAAPPLGPEELAAALARRNETFRTRILQVMLLGALVVRPLPAEVAERLEAYAAELGVGDGMLTVAHRFAEGSLGLAAIDFERNGYTADWSDRDQQARCGRHDLGYARVRPLRLRRQRLVLLPR